MLVSTTVLPADIRAGLRDVATVGSGYLPLGAAFGMVLAAKGLDWYWAPITAAIIYAGSAEFLAINLILGGVSAVTAFTAGLFVNFRHIFYGLSFPLHLVKNPLARLYGVHALTDEAYAIVAARPADDFTGRQIFTIQLGCQICWVSGATVGAAAGSIIHFSPQATQSLSFILTALFVTLTIDALKNSRAYLPTAFAAILAVAAAIWAGRWMLIVTLTTFALGTVLFSVYMPRYQSVLSRYSSRRQGGANESH